MKKIKKPLKIKIFCILSVLKKKEIDEIKNKEAEAQGEIKATIDCDTPYIKCENLDCLF